LITYRRIFVGNQCNNRCLYCDYRHRGESNPDLGEISEDMDHAVGVDSVEFYGGEPTIREDFISIIDRAQEKGFKRIKLVTNGRMFSDMDMAIQAIESGCYLFEIKVHGSNPRVHDAITGVDGSFWQTIQGIQNLRGIDMLKDSPFDPFIGVKISICKENSADIENAVVNLLQFKVDRIILSFDDNALAMTKALPHIQNAINISILNRVWIVTQKIPLCLMEGFEHHVSEVYAVSHNRFGHHKNCAKCVYGDICPGVNVDYLKKFGFREFRHVTKSKYSEDMLRLRNEEN
jgi:sulfatase maturation enzyme AslB (radical SAM superfamily)